MVLARRLLARLQVLHRVGCPRALCLASAIITGSGFSATAAQNQVTVGGLAATVTTASATRLTITVPYANCLPPRREELRVKVGAGSDATTVGVAPLSQEDMALEPGWYRSTHAGSGCVHLPVSTSGGEYLLGVVSTSEDPASVAGVTLTGIPGDATVLAASALGTVAAVAAPQQDVFAAIGLERGQFTLGRTMRGSGPSMAGLRPGTEPIRRDWARHNEIMADGMQLVRRLGPSTGEFAQTAFDRSRAVAATDTFAFFAEGTSCTDRNVVRAVLRFVGDHTAWLEDIENPGGGFSETEFATLDAFYGSNILPAHEDYFGRLTDIEETGKVVILMTKDANRQDVRQKSFLGGWVWPPDLLSRSQCETSNAMEIFYGRVPDPDGVFGNPWTKQRTLEYYPSLLAHEITHLVQSGYLVYGSAQHDFWELEGGATLAEQLVAYRLFGHGSGQDLGWNAFNASDESRSWYGNAWLQDMARFFGWDSDGDGTGRVRYAPEQCTAARPTSRRRRLEQCLNRRRCYPLGGRSESASVPSTV